MLRKSKKSISVMSRKNRNAIIGSVLLVLAVLAVLDRTIGNNTQPKTFSDTSQKNSADLRKYHKKNFAVTTVIDGDTLDIDIPDGKYKHTRIRLWGVDTPETKNSPKGQMYFGAEASAFAKEAAFEKNVTVYLDEGSDDNRGKYGRLLAYVQLADGSFLNERLLIEGYAYADLRFRHSLYNKYKQLESVARSQKKGLWENVIRQQLPDWLQREKPELLKN